MTERVPSRTFSWLKAPTSAFTFKTLVDTSRDLLCDYAISFFAKVRLKLYPPAGTGTGKHGIIDGPLPRVQSFDVAE